MIGIWLTRIADRSVRLSEHKSAADFWSTCAVGEVREDVPYVVATAAYGEPEDKRLNRLGKAFYKAVRRNRRKDALRVYLAIQRRVVKLAGVR